MMNNSSSMNVSSISNVQFVPSLDSMSFNKSRGQLLDLQRKVKEAKNERLFAMYRFLYNNRGQMFAERDLAQAFDLTLRDVVGARQSMERDYRAKVTRIFSYQLTPDFQQVLLNKKYPVYMGEDENGCSIYEPVVVQIFARKISVKWAPLDDNDTPILDRVSYRQENQYAWMFS